MNINLVELLQDTWRALRAALSLPFYVASGIYALIGFSAMIAAYVVNLAAGLIRGASDDDDES